MLGKKNILIVLLIVAALALIIEFIRLDFVTKLSSNENAVLLNHQQISDSRGGADNDREKRYLIIYDDQPQFVQIKENIEQVLDYIKTGYEAVPVNQVRTINKKYQTVILIMEEIDKLRPIDELMQYVFEGGHLFFAFRLNATPGFMNLYRKLGIYESSEFFETEGIRLLDDVLIKGTGLEMKEPNFLVNSTMSLRISQDCQPLAETLDGVKLLWKKPYGQGAIIYYNGSTLAGKKSRGLILGSLGYLDDPFIYPILNAKITFIDDFPAPVPQGTNEKIMQEFGRTIPRFYSDIWWPNMLELASRYDLKYTGLVIGTYNDETEEIKPNSIDLNEKDLISFGREILGHGGEIGIHGYNHQPLTTQQLTDQDLGYKPWKDLSVMADSIREVTRMARGAFPNYAFQVYVPPSNILPPDGRQAILEAQTGLAVIASVYSKGDAPDALEQEFSVAADGLIELPRLTSGYENSDTNRWEMMNGLTMHGVYSHFVHPDDILDEDRTHGKSWSQLLEEFDGFNKKVFNDFPWLRSMTGTEAANELIKYLAMEPRYQKNGQYLRASIKGFSDSAYFILRTAKTIESVQNASIQEVDKGIYLICADSPDFQINFSR